MFKFIKNQDKKFKSVVICLIALIFLMVSIFTMNFFTNKKYNNKIIVSNATVKTLKTDNNKEIKKDELINSSDELSYKILYTLETKDKKQLSGRTAIVKATLSDEENNYATWELVNDTNIESEIFDSGKTLMLTISNVTTNKQYEVMAKLKIVNAPNEFKISPKVTVEEKTSKEKFVELKSESGIVNTKSISGKIFNEQKGYYEKNLELELCKLIDGSCINTKTTYTNTDGSFSFSELENGIYQINIKNNNYALLEEINPLTITDNSLNINIKVANQTKFRASIKKYIDKIEINENGQKKEYNYKEVDQAVVSVKKMQNAKIKITYKFVIKNESTKEGYVKVIKENLPEGLEFNPEYEENTNWYIHDGKIYNKSLAQEPLEAFEEKELYITLNSKTTDLAKSYLNKVSMTGENYYTVKYVANNEVIKEESVIDSDILEKFDIEREGYTFEGWYTDKEYKNKYDFTKPVEDDLVLYAKLINNNKKCTVEYLRQNGKLFAEKEIDCGTKAEDIEGPKDEEGYKFNCWEKVGEKECFDFNKTVDEDIELTSHMDQYFDVKFYEEDGKTSYEKKKYDQEIKRGDYAKEPEKVPSKKGHEFECWKDLSTGKCFDFSNTPIDDKKDFIPSFKADQNRVIYVDEKNEENTVFKTYDKVDYGKEVPKPNTVPTHEGYTFTYWATKDENNNYVEFDYENNKMPDNDLYLYAQYTTNVHNVTFIDEKQETDNIYEIVENVEYGSLIIKTKADPYHAGFYFTGWAYKNKNDKLTKFDLTKDTMPDNDLTLYAQYTDNKHEVIYKIPECTGDSCESTPKCTGDECIIEKIDVPDGEVLTPPEDPLKECYTFKYWSLYETGLDENGNESRYDFSTPVKKDTIIYAIFEVTKYDVTYVDNGVVIKTEKIKCGKIIPTDDPNECDKNDKNCDNTCTDPEGCPDFVCWRNADDPSKCLPSTPANKNLTLVSYYINLPEPVVLHTPTEWTNESKTSFNEKNNEKVSVQMNFPTDAKIVYKTTKKTVSEDGTIVYNVEEKETTENLTLTSSDYDIKYQVVAEKDIDDETTTFGKYDLSDTWKLYESPFEIEKNAIIVGKVSTKNKAKEYASSHLKHEVKNIDKKSPVIDSVEADNITYQSFDIKLNSKDLQSGVKQFNIYLNGEKYGETKKLEDAKKESNETFTVSGLEELTTYTIKLEIFDDVGNMTTSDDQEVTTVEKGHEPVAQIIGRFGNLYEDEGTYEIFYSLEDARKSCGDNQCTVQMLKSTNESIDILDSQDITLDLNGKKVIGVKDYTINNSGNFIVIDDYGYQNNEEYGGIFNNNDNGISINNYSTGTLTLGVNETPQSVNIVKPLIQGTKYGIYAEDVSTLNFYDGLVKGKIAIYGTVDDTPYLYNVAIRMENTIQTAKLSVLTDAEARVNKTKYYTKIANAVSDPSTAKGVTTQTLTSKNLLELISQDNTTNFVYDEETGVLKNNNNFTSDSALGYITLDLTDKTKDQLLIINAESDSNGHAYVKVAESIGIKDYYFFDKDCLININEPTEAKDYKIELTHGKIYYINIKYSSEEYDVNTTNTDTFKINSIDLSEDSSFISSKNGCDGNECFKFTNDSYPIKSNYSISDHYNYSKENYFITKFDLSDEIKDKIAYIDYEVKGGDGSYKLDIYNGNYEENTTDKVYSSDTNQGISKQNYITLKAGQVNYISFVFQLKTDNYDSSANSVLNIKNISLVESYDIDSNIINGSRYYFKKDDTTGVFTSNNKRNNTKSTSYIKIDTTSNVASENYLIRYKISSEQYDYGHIYLSESQDVNDSSTTELLSVSGLKNDSITISLDPGKIYYLHLAYEKDSSGSENDDNFSIISIDKSSLYTFLRTLYKGNYTSVVNRPKVNEVPDTVQMLKNINMPNTLVVPAEQNLILDLNGYTLSNIEGSSVINNSGTLKVIDSVFDKKVALAYNELDKIQEKNDAEAVELQKQYDKDYEVALSKVGKNKIEDYVQDGLEIQIDFKENVIKKTGEENYGIISPASDKYGAPTFKDDYIEFDGENDYADLGEVNYDNITIEVMVRLDSTADGQSIYSNSYYGGYSLSTRENKIVASTAHQRGRWTSLYSNKINEDITTYTMTSSDSKMVLYENGINIGSEKVTSPIYQTEDDEHLIIGSQHVMSKNGMPKDFKYYSNFLKGRIYAIRVYNRALSESEVQDNYNVDLDIHSLSGQIIHKQAIPEIATIGNLNIESTGKIVGNIKYGVYNNKGAIFNLSSGSIQTNKDSVTMVYNSGIFGYGKYSKLQTINNKVIGIYNDTYGIINDTSGEIISTGNYDTLISNNSSKQKKFNNLTLKNRSYEGYAIEANKYDIKIYDSYILNEYSGSGIYANSVDIYNSNIYIRNIRSTKPYSIDAKYVNIYNSNIEGLMSITYRGNIESSTFYELTIGIDTYREKNKIINIINSTSSGEIRTNDEDQILNIEDSKCGILNNIRSTVNSINSVFSLVYNSYGIINFNGLSKVEYKPVKEPNIYNRSAIDNRNGGTININDYFILNSTYDGITCASGVVNVGNSSEDYSKEFPKINASDYSFISEAIIDGHPDGINIYSGIFKSGINKSIDGPIKSIRENYGLNIEKNDEQSTEIMSLSTERKPIKDIDTNEEYQTITEALTTLENKSLLNLQLMDTVYSVDNIVIPTGKTLNLDFNGHNTEIYANKFIKNNGVLKLYDSTYVESDESKVLGASLLNGYVSIENINEMSIKGFTIEKNNSNSTLKNQYLINNSGNLTIDYSKIENKNSNLFIKNLQNANLIINDGIFNLDNEFNNEDGSTLTINNGEKYTIMNNGIANINGGNINYIDNKKTLNISGGVFDKVSGKYLYSLVNERECTVNMTGGHVNNGHVGNDGTFNIKGDSYIKTDFYNYFSEGGQGGTLIMGEKDGIVNKTYPSIRNLHSKVSSNLNFYDGNILFVQDNPIDNHKITDIEDGYSITKGNLNLDFYDESQNECYYLDKMFVIKNINSSKQYANIQDAIDEATNGDNLRMLRNYKLVNTSSIVIPENKKIILDLDEYTISSSQDEFIINNGILSIVGNNVSTEDSKYLTVAGIKNIDGNSITNNGTLHLTNIALEGNLINNGNLTTDLVVLKNIINNSGEASFDLVKGTTINTTENGNTVVNEGIIDYLNFSETATGTLNKLTMKYLKNSSTETINVKYIKKLNTVTLPIEKEYKGVFDNASTGTITIDNGTIDYSSDPLFTNESTGIINIKGGTYRGTNLFYNKGTINIGTKGDLNSNKELNVSKDSVKFIMVGELNLGTTSNVNFYDGMIMNEDNGVIQSTKKSKINLKNLSMAFNEFEDGYHLTYEDYEDEGTNYYKFYLSKTKAFKNITNDQTYSSLKDAVNDATSGDTIKVVESYVYTNKYDDLITDKNLIFDLNGKLAIPCVNIIANGNLSFINTSDIKDEDITKFVLSATIKGNANFENVDVLGTINNLSNLSVNNSYVEKVNSVSSTNSLITVNDSKISLLDSSGNIINTTNSNISDIFIRNNSVLTVNSGNITTIKDYGGNITVENGSINKIYVKSQDENENDIVQDSIVTIKNGTIKSIENFKNLNILGGTIESITNYGICSINIENTEYNIYSINKIDNMSGNLNVNKGKIKIVTAYNGNIVLKENVIINSFSTWDEEKKINNPNVYIYGSTIEEDLTSLTGVINIVSGTIKGTGIHVSGKVVLGQKDGIVNTLSPSITGSKKAITIDGGSVYYYDGILTGPIDNVYDGKIKEIEPGYKMVSTKNADGKTESIVLGMVSEDESNVTMNGINFPDIQTAINSATSNEPVLTLQRNNEISSQIEIPEGYNVKIYLNNFTITYGDIVISKNDISKLSSIITGNGTMTVMDSDASGVSAAINSLLAVNKLNKRIVLYQTDDGNKLEITRNYKLYKLNGTNYYKVNVEEDSENVGRYLVTKADNDITMTTINGKIYLKGLESGNYKVVDDNSKEIIFNITDDGKVSGNVKEMGFIDFNKIISQSKALLTVTIQTGIEQRKYGLLILLISTICGLLYLVKTKVSKNN